MGKIRIQNDEFRIQNLFFEHEFKEARKIADLPSFFFASILLPFLQISFTSLSQPRHPLTCARKNLRLDVFHFPSSKLGNVLMMRALSTLMPTTFLSKETI